MIICESGTFGDNFVWGGGSEMLENRKCLWDINFEWSLKKPLKIPQSTIAICRTPVKIPTRNLCV